MKVWQIGFIGAALVLLVGCKSLGLGGKRVDYGAGAKQAPALEVPPDLSAPARDERYRVPGSDGEEVANLSDYDKGGAASGRTRGDILPEVRGVHLERSGTQRWLVVSDSPENVWFATRIFLQENGLTIESEEQAAGVMETGWAESSGGISNAPARRNQYRVRMERTKDGASTEIYITHRAMEEVLSGDKSASKWRALPGDPEMEAIMLQRLKAHFGGSDTSQASGHSGAAQAGAVALRQLSGGSSIVVVNDAFDRAWRRVGLAIERAGLVVEDRDRVRGTYFLRMSRKEGDWLDKLQFWKDSDGANTRYRVNVKDNGALCEVSVAAQDDSGDDASRQILEAIHRHLERDGAGAPAGSVSAINPTGAAGTASLQEIFDGSSVIVMNDTFERSWSRLGLAVERAGLAQEGNDRSAGIYFLKPAEAETSLLDKLEFWRGGQDTRLRYRVNLRDGGKACEVSVTDQYGASDDAARQMIEAIYENINQ